MGQKIRIKLQKGITYKDRLQTGQVKEAEGEMSGNAVRTGTCWIPINARMRIHVAQEVGCDPFTAIHQINCLI